jgi:hypothetical protein
MELTIKEVISVLISPGGRRGVATGPVHKSKICHQIDTESLMFQLKKLLFGESELSVQGTMFTSVRDSLKPFLSYCHILLQNRSFFLSFFKAI